MNMTTLILFGSFVLFLVLGLPVSISLGLSSLVSFFYCGIPIVTIAQRLYTGMDSFPLMAIPLFILAGNLMTAGGISRKIVDFANILTPAASAAVWPIRPFSPARSSPRSPAAARPRPSPSAR